MDKPNYLDQTESIKKQIADGTFPVGKNFWLRDVGWNIEYLKYIYESGKYNYDPDEEEIKEIITQDFFLITDLKDIEKAKSGLNENFIWIKNEAHLTPNELLSLGFAPLVGFIPRYYARAKELAEMVLDLFIFNKPRDEIDFFFDKSTVDSFLKRRSRRYFFKILALSNRRFCYKKSFNKSKFFLFIFFIPSSCL